MKIQTILDSINLGAIALSEFQRAYVWNQGQVRSLYILFKDKKITHKRVWPDLIFIKYGLPLGIIFM